MARESKSTTEVSRECARTVSAVVITESTAHKKELTGWPMSTTSSWNQALMKRCLESGYKESVTGGLPTDKCTRKTRGL